MLTVTIWVLLLGGLWGAFVLPSFLESGADSPARSTRSFEGEIAKLAALNTIDANERARRALRARRRRTVSILAFLAVVTLAMTLWQMSWGWLLVNLIFGAFLIAYVLKLVEIRNRELASKVIELPAVEESVSRAVNG